jgi:cyclic pyranopterin phosphate synthase
VTRRDPPSRAPLDRCDPPSRAPLDRRGRPLRDLRLSVTDRCNLRCAYCMPEDHYRWLPREQILTFEELSRLVDAFCAVGVEKVRLTGGEPLMRTGLAELVEMLSTKAAVTDLAMTTNGVLFARHAAELRAAGLGRVTISLDTLRADRFERLSGRRSHGAVLGALAAATEAGFTGTKIDTVVMDGVNDDELVELIEFAKTVPAEVRFIEYMDVGGATRWDPRQVCSAADILELLGAYYGEVRPVDTPASAPARRFRLADGTVFGIVASTTQPFCASCDRSRITADGMWYRCLYAPSGTDLRRVLRDGASGGDLVELIGQTWMVRRDQGAVDRLRKRARGALLSVTDLREDPHLEMHTRGG